MKKLVTLFLVMGFVAFLFGCSNGNSWYVIEDISEPETRIINDRGQFPAPITFASGASLETTEDNTLTENVVVNVTETKSCDAGLNPIGKPEFIYVYGITAALEDSLGNRTEVKSLKKPLKLTLSAGHLGTEGICYAGVREDKNSKWKYTRLSDKGATTLSQRSIRASASGSIQPVYELSLYKMGIEIALFAYNKPPEEAQKDISGAGMTATPTTSLLTLDENGNYCDNLDMDIKLEGDNLSSLRDSDITVSIIYRSNKSTPEEIKINGMPPVNTETRSDAAVSGENSYVHILTLNKDNFKADFGGETSVKFSLDLKGKSSSDFPTDFIVEVNSADNIENLIPFTYSNNVSYKAEAVYSITYDLDGGSLAEGDANPDKYTAASDTFTLKNPVKEGYAFAGWTGTGLSSATMVVTIEKGSAGSREYKAVWIQNAPDTYTLTVLKGTGIATVSEGGNYEAGKEITLEYTLENGYKFTSWTSEDISADEAGKFTMPAKNVTVTANAGVITYRIAYEGIDGATFADGDNPETYDVASADITLNNPTKAGYTFAGWTGTGLSSATMLVIIEKGSTGNRSYIASWSENLPDTYTLTVLKGIGIATVSEDGSYEAGKEITLEYTLENGYEFISWTSDDVTVADNKITMPAKNVTVTANASIINYSISYDGLDGADVVSNPVAYDVTSATITLNNPTKEGYTFRGWSGTDLTGDENQTVTIAQGSTGDKTYTANWTLNSYTITYNLDGGSLGEGVINPVSYDITSATITLSNPVRGGYDFLGWTGTGIEEGTASMTVTIPQGSTDAREYVASWTMASVLTFTLPGDVTLEMRRCPAGSFVRGEAYQSGGWWDDYDGDGATVTISKDFYMGTYEVTNAQYVAITSTNPSSENAGEDFAGSNQPVVGVSWNNITDPAGFIAEMNTRFASQLPAGYKFALPTEAQWEYACRAGTESDLNSGENIENYEDSDDHTSEVARYWQNCGATYNRTHEVGGLASNSFGLYDMHGNVWEWCRDWYKEVGFDDARDPEGPSSGTAKVARGGSWDYIPRYARSAARYSCSPDDMSKISYDLFGFRVALVKKS